MVKRGLRILLAHNSPYYPALGGGDKSNRLLMEALAGRGHETLVLSRVAEFGASSHARLAAELTTRGIESCAAAEGLQFRLGGVAVRVFTNGRSFRGWIAARVREFQPDVILASTDDPAHVMLDAAVRAENTRVVYMVRALIALPFGPHSPHPSSRSTDMLRDLDGVVAVSEHVAAYAREWGQMEAVHVPISLPDRAVYSTFGSLENRFVTLINPCAGKGLAVFIEIARRMPKIEFAAVPSWGTNAADREILGSLQNVTVLRPVDDIDEIYRQSRIVLVPSLWAEARSRIPLEAMARGIPVLASNVAGMEEAMLGMDYILPVRAAEGYRMPADHSMVPVVEIPPQDVEPWIEVLTHLLSDRALYTAISKRVEARAHEYVRSVSAGPFEAYLEEVVRSPRKSRAPKRGHFSETHLPQGLSRERRALLLSRLRKQKRLETGPR